MSLTDFASEGPFATIDTFINIKLSKNITRVILAKAKVRLVYWSTTPLTSEIRGVIRQSSFVSHSANFLIT